MVSNQKIKEAAKLEASHPLNDLHCLSFQSRTFFRSRVLYNLYNMVLITKVSTKAIQLNFSDSFSTAIDIMEKKKRKMLQSVYENMWKALMQ